MDARIALRATADLLKSWALEAGFDRAGVAGLEPLERGEALVRWLARGDQAGMEYLGRRTEARLDPSRIFPGARSVLCVALQYHPLYRGGGERQPEPPGDLWRRVARYARGADYHDVMSIRLRELEDRIRQAFPGCETRRYVDTGPVLERELAARAGMGAVGKNTMLLHPEGGSWFLLGEIFLSLDVAPATLDPPLTDLCGSCTLCLEACPTGALPEPYRLDSNRCISYWTIEHRGPLPPEARRAVGSWVFGCDVCQEVCPWNAEPAGAVHPEMELPPERAELDLARLLRLPREEYVERFRGSPMKRAKLEGLQRNAAVAMGNRLERRYAGPLAEALREGEPLVRGHAAWALGRIGGGEARRALEEALEREPDEGVRGEIEVALGREKAHAMAWAPVHDP
ncbi:MAG TPA: tRNA epoxyqueuosine(34) reductase QueG [Thermoanaerobaculia bacterium]|jgi:epoxyqueuosine reductase|nr:tRNA epoxyqueuosine(34) reductase QueG [Thermoanaerobaculia bacterium]